MCDEMSSRSSEMFLFRHRKKFHFLGDTRTERHFFELFKTEETLTQTANPVTT